MSKFNPTDEEILSFLMKDCSQELSQKINNEININPALKERIESIALIKSEIKSSPLLLKKSTWSELSLAFVGRQAAFASVIFFVGIFVGSNFSVFSKKENKEIETKISVSKPLSWDGSKLNSVM